MTDIMLDLETLGNIKNNCIVQIGACEFHRETGEIGKEFLVNVDAESCIEIGCEYDSSTIYWWLSQSKEAINSIIKEPRIKIKDALEAFNEFYTKKPIWSHATFDFVALMNIYRLAKIEPKFGYKTARDLRTLVDLGKVKVDGFKREGLHHNALDDCKYQVKYAVASLNNIKKKQK